MCPHCWMLCVPCWSLTVADHVNKRRAALDQYVSNNDRVVLRDIYSVRPCFCMWDIHLNTFLTSMCMYTKGQRSGQELYWVLAKILWKWLQKDTKWSERHKMTTNKHTTTMKRWNMKSNRCKGLQSEAKPPQKHLKRLERDTKQPYTKWS